MPTFQGSPELKTLCKVIDRLQSASIPYMLTGSMALNFYGHPRATNDFDIIIEIRRDAVDRIFSLFKDDFYIVRETVQAEVAREGFFNVIDNETIFKVDFIVRKSDLFSIEQFKRRRLKKLGALEAYVISPEDLILAKLNWSRESLSEMQERDIKNLLTLLAKELDYTYMEQWAEALGMLKRLRSFYVSS